jgi:hypothetical protein
LETRERSSAPVTSRRAGPASGHPHEALEQLDPIAARQVPPQQDSGGLLAGFEHLERGVRAPGSTGSIPNSASEQVSDVRSSDGSITTSIFMCVPLEVRPRQRRETGRACRGRGQAVRGQAGRGPRVNHRAGTHRLEQGIPPERVVAECSAGSSEEASKPERCCRAERSWIFGSRNPRQRRGAGGVGRWQVLEHEQQARAAADAGGGEQPRRREPGVGFTRGTGRRRGSFTRCS